MLIDESPKLDFNDVLLVPQRSTLVSRKQAKLERKLTFKWSNANWKGVPIIASNMDTVGTFKAWGALKKFDMLTCLHKHYSINDWKDFTNSVHRISNSSFYYQDPEKRLDNIIISIGIKEEDLKKLKTIHEILKSNYEKAQPWICIDVANGYSEYFINFVRKVRREYPSSVIIAGNVVTGEMTQELILNGADIVKVGIGSGSACTTRLQAGVGYPQFSAIVECANRAHGLKGHIISDGGCVVPGDVGKAFGAGADFVMLGGMLAGHTENTEYTKTDSNGKITAVYYGMSSDTAMEKYYGEVADYRSSEGRTLQIPFKGIIDKTIKSILGGLRSTCTYIGAENIKAIPKCANFIKVNRQVNNPFGGNNE